MDQDMTKSITPRCSRPFAPILYLQAYPRVDTISSGGSWVLLPYWACAGRCPQRWPRTVVLAAWGVSLEASSAAYPMFGILLPCGFWMLAGCNPQRHLGCFAGTGFRSVPHGWYTVTLEFVGARWTWSAAAAPCLFLSSPFLACLAWVLAGRSPQRVCTCPRWRLGVFRWTFVRSVPYMSPLPAMPRSSRGSPCSAVVSLLNMFPQRLSFCARAQFCVGWLGCFAGRGPQRTSIVPFGRVML